MSWGRPTADRSFEFIHRRQSANNVNMLFVLSFVRPFTNGDEDWEKNMECMRNAFVSKSVEGNNQPVCPFRSYSFSRSLAIGRTAARTEYVMAQAVASAA